MNCPAMPPGGGRGMKFRKPFSPKTRKITPARYRAITEAILITGFSFAIAPLYGVKYIDAKRLDSGILQRDAVFMTRSNQGKYHAWLVMMKEMSALPRNAADGFEENGHAVSHFAVLDI